MKKWVSDSRKWSCHVIFDDFRFKNAKNSQHDSRFCIQQFAFESTFNFGIRSIVDFLGNPYQIPYNISVQNIFNIFNIFRHIMWYDRKIQNQARSSTYTGSFSEAYGWKNLHHFCFQKNKQSTFYLTVRFLQKLTPGCTHFKSAI